MAEERAIPPLPEISHIGFVVDDLEDAMDRFHDFFGIGPWLRYDYEPPRFTDRRYRGEPTAYSMRIALSDVGGPIDLGTQKVSTSTFGAIVEKLFAIRDRVLGRGKTAPGPDALFHAFPTPNMPGVNVELIEPVSGTSTYTDEFATSPLGVHHVGCFSYDDPYATVEAYLDAGIPIIQAGRYEGLEFWYLDLSEVLDGLLLEIAANIEHLPAPEAIYEP